MQIVIKMPDAMYEDIESGKYGYSNYVHTAIVNGTPLPKGHGRLIDADRLRSMYSINQANFNTVVGIQKWIDDADTIIEADTELEQNMCDTNPFSDSRFGMTREEAIEQLEKAYKECVDLGQTCGKDSVFWKRAEAIKVAIKALEQEPCDDAISREDLEECKELMTDVNGDTVYAVKMSDIRQLPSVNPQEPKWIPVSERLPEDRREVLVTAYWHETYQVMMASYFGDGLWWCVPFNNCGEHMQRLKPRAWMTLPKPYEPQESEE